MEVSTSLMGEESAKGPAQLPTHGSVQVTSHRGEAEAMALALIGLIEKSDSSNRHRFDFRIGNPLIEYTVKGMAQRDQEKIMNYGNVVVSKKKGHEIVTLPNRGQVDREFPILTRASKWRRLTNVNFSGIPLEGEYTGGNNNLDLSKLKVLGQDSKGGIVYGDFTGRYKTKKDVQFGDLALSPADPTKEYLLNYNETFGGEKSYDVNLRIGDLLVTGKIGIKARVPDEAKGEADDAKKVFESGNLALKVAKADGTAFHLSNPNSPPTSDDMKVRKLIAFLELVSFDLLN